MPVRLHKHLASCGVGSRRQCEAYMAEGRVTVDGLPAREPGTQVDPDRQEICFNGRRVLPEPFVYLLVNKPPGYVCTSHDPQGRPLVIDLVPREFGRIYTVGRLDSDSEGMIVLTNDGDFAHRLSHPRHEVVKKYELWLQRPLSSDDIKRWKTGIETDGEILKVLSIEPATPGKAGYGYRVKLGEGKNRHLRRMAESSDRVVLRLKRIAIGDLALGQLKRSAWRKLDARELKMLLGARAGITLSPVKKKGSRRSPAVDTESISG